MTPTDPTIINARKALNNMRSYVRATGLTGWVKDRGASGQYRRAYYRVILVEDALGVDAAGPLADRLTALRHEAVRAGLLTVDDVIAAESKAMADADAERVYAAKRAARVTA